MNPAREKVDKERWCRVCRGADPEAAHLWPRSLGAEAYEEPDLIVPLCRTCHGEFDAHNLELLPYLTSDEETALVSWAGIARAFKRVTRAR